MKYKTCTKCGNKFYRTERMSDLTWHKMARCGYKCQQNLVDKDPPPEVDRFPFIKMKLSCNH